MTNPLPPPPHPTTPKGLSTSGKLFFGGLCVGTFGLGVWQMQRLLEKQGLVEERSSQLEQEPSQNLAPLLQADNGSKANFRRLLVKGVFRYEHELLVGPRGSPPGVSMPRQGLSAKSKANNGASSGAAPGPQGYHVITPLELLIAPDSDSRVNTSEPPIKKTIWVNRGWIPITLIADSSGRRRPPSLQQHSESLAAPPITWDRPAGSVEITAVQSSVERT